jgi:hypothetical protein
MARGRPLTDRLCLVCGLCCSGALFKDVELQPGDDPEKLAALGLLMSRGSWRRASSRPVKAASCRPACPAKFTQPCAALQHDGRCRLYADRPRRCRDFDCALLKSAAAGQCGLPSARRTIRTACARADRVRRLLRALGDEDEQLALSLRFKRLHRRLARARLDPEKAAAFGQLTLAVHDLNLLLRESFYA